MKNADIKNLSLGDLENKLTELNSQFNKVKLAHRISPIENPIQIRDLRRAIARIKTQLTNQQ